LDFDGQFANSTQKINPYLPIAIFATSFLHVHCLSIASRFLSSNLSHWVKPISTTLFSCFIKTKYDEKRWVENLNLNLKGGMDCLVFREPLMELTLPLQSPHGPLHGLYILLL